MPQSIMYGVLKEFQSYKTLKGTWLRYENIRNQSYEKVLWRFRSN